MLFDLPKLADELKKIDVQNKTFFEMSEAEITTVCYAVLRVSNRRELFINAIGPELCETFGINPDIPF